MKEKNSFFLKVRGCKKTKCIKKKSISELSNYLGGCMGKKKFPFFLRVRGAKVECMKKKCIGELSNYLGGCMGKDSFSFSS